MASIDKSLPELRILPQSVPFHLHRLPPTSHPEHLLAGLSRQGDFLSLTRTRDEVSIVYAGQRMQIEESEYAGPWAALRVAGPMPFHLTGILHALTGALATASIPIFALSTWDTDYVLVHEEKMEGAISALKNDGWIVEDWHPTSGMI